MHCTTFAGDWVHLVTGQDPIADYRGKYSTEAEARALLKQLDGHLFRALQKRFGKPLHPAQAQRGDIAYAEWSCGIFFSAGHRIEALFLGPGGFSRARVQDVEWAFRLQERKPGWPRMLNEYLIEAQEIYKREGFGWNG